LFAHLEIRNMKKLFSLLFAFAFSIGANAQTQMIIGPQSASYSSMVRGYHFTSPVSFVICALYIPPDAPGAAGQTQHIRVVRFTAGAPPAFPGTTNSFVQLFSITGAGATTTVACNIPVSAGDVIGIYGARAANCINSYDGVNFPTTIMASGTTLSRSGMQACISAGQPMANIWSEVNFQIGRIFMYYNCCPTPTITTNASAANICAGTSVTILGGGAQTYTWQPGNVTTQNITVTPSVTTTYTLGGTANNCTAAVTVSVQVNNNPTITALANDGPVCQGSPLNITSTVNTTAPATYAWVGPNSFTANTANTTINNAQPAATGMYSLTVTNTYTSASSPTQITCQAIATTSAAVVPVGSLNVTPFYTLCSGSNLNLTASANGATSYSWAGPSFNSALQNPSINNVNPSHSGNYTVTAYYTNPSTTLVCTNLAVVNVSVVPKNQVTAFSNANVCQNGIGTFSATAPAASGYEWFGPNGFTSVSQVNAINNIQPVNAGNYTVNALFTIGSVTCTTTSYIPLNVIPVPSIAVIPNINVCHGQNASFSASAPGALSYMWSGPNSFTMNSPNPIFTNLTPTASGAYTVTAAFSNGNITCYSSNVTNLLVNPYLPFNLGADKMLCSNSDLFLNGPGGATAYNWWGSTSYTSNTQSMYVPGLNPSNSGIYVLEVDLNGCKTYDSVRVTVLTPIIFTLTPSNKTICKGDKVNWVVGAAQGSENYAYTWNPAVFITGPTGSVQAGEPLGTTIYNISAYDIACPNYVIQTNFTVTVKQPPQPNIVMPPGNVCEPMCYVYNSHTYGSSKAVMYDFGHDRVYEGDSINICLPAGQHYMRIIATGTNGCKGTYDYTVPITVNPKPGADFTWDPDPPTTANNSVIFKPTTKYGTTFAYEWAFANSVGAGKPDTSSLKNPMKMYDNNGKFPAMLVVTNEFGCKDSIYKIIIVDEDVAVYIPNTFTPNDDNINDVFNIKGLGLKPDGYVMQIFDRWGTLIFTTRDINKGWDGTVKGQKAAEGVYVYSVKVIGDNGVGKKEFKGHVTLLK
jgi:gliding motility-associated-like protein